VELVTQAIDWLRANAGLTTALFVSSVLLRVASLWLGHWYLTRVPADYFLQQHKPFEKLRHKRPVLWWMLMIGKNLLGSMLLLAGFVMFFTPGQGVLTLLLGMALMDFPGKQRLERWILQRPPVLKVVNAMRSRADKPPLKFS
jgi:hypothetical protein